MNFLKAITLTEDITWAVWVITTSFIYTPHFHHDIVFQTRKVSRCVVMTTMTNRRQLGAFLSCSVFYQSKLWEYQRIKAITAQWELIYRPTQR